MTTTAVAERDAPAIQGRVSPPPAIANAQQSASFRLGQVLKELIHAAPHAFTSENQVFAACEAVDAFLAANVPSSARRALQDIPARAPLEDVTKRIPPNGATFGLPAAAPAQIDYDKLAAAIVRAQYAMSQSENPPADEPAPAAELQETEDDG